MSTRIDLKELVKAGVHFGHQTWRWCPKMRPYIWGAKNDIHLIDVAKTARQMEKAAKFLEEIAAQGKPILWVGTKKAAQEIVDSVGARVASPHVSHRWIGGTLTNYPQVKKSVTKLLHYEDILSKSGEHLYTKKERGVFQKMVERLLKNVGGIRKLTWPVGAIVVVDVKKENTAVREAAAAGVPVVALVDTNSDPSFVDYVIPANDDIPRSISIILNYLGDAVERGKAVAGTRAEEEMTAESYVEKVLEGILAETEEEAQARKRKAGAQQQRRRPSGPVRRGPAKPAASKP